MKFWFFPVFVPLTLGLVLAGAAAQQSQLSNQQQSIAEQEPSAEQQAAADEPVTTGILPAAPRGQAVKNEPDPLLEVPPMPQGKVSLVGGTVDKIDRVRERLVVHAFRGPKIRVAFDERTHIYRDGVETTMLGIHKGDRIYVDTMLDKDGVFARNIRVETEGSVVDARGQVISYDPRSGSMTLRDELSAQAVSFGVNANTRVIRSPGGSVGMADQAGSNSDLQPGALVTVQFVTGKGEHGQAREIKVLASPGMAFTFAGKVTHLDLSHGLLAVHNDTDSRTYDIVFPRQMAAADLGIGSDVRVDAVFNGKGYTARTIQMLGRRVTGNR